MKKIPLIYLFMATTLITLLSSCSGPILKDSDTILDNRLEHITYRLALGFKDSEGNDLTVPLAEEQWIEKGDSYWAGKINPDQYSFDFFPSNPPDGWDNTIYNFKQAPGFIPAVHRPRLQLLRFDDNGHMCVNGYCAAELSIRFDDKGSVWVNGHSAEGNDKCSWYLFNNIDFSLVGLQKTIKYQITCPAIFGDSSVHEFITYWAEDENDDPNVYGQVAICTKVEYEGKVITPIRGETIMHNEFPDSSLNIDSEFVTYLVDIVVDK